MRPDEARALGSLAGDGAAGIAAQARDLHGAVAGRVFSALADAAVPAAPVRVLHDAVAGPAYGATRGLLRGLGWSSGQIAALTRPVDGPSLHDGVRGRVTLGALSAALGDRLAAGDSPLAARFALRADPRHPVNGRVVVFVHGLGETEDAWRLGATVYGDRLAPLGFTPVYARYNTGRSIGDSAAALADALTRLHGTWPVEPQEIVLVGHSMGGLVIREAPLHVDPAGWPARVRLIAMLGSPHEGAGLARAAAAGERALARLPETRAFVAPLRDRSAGVRDLARGRTAPFLASAEHLFISASLTRDPGAPLGRLLGDLLVQRRSAWAQRTRTERLRFDRESYRHLGGATHFDLLGHPAIAELLERRLTRRALPLGHEDAPRPQMSLSPTNR